MEASEQAGICRQARLVLWFLRCAVLRNAGDAEANTLLTHGLALAHASSTTTEFLDFADTLCSAGIAPGIWHHPCCYCVSTEELAILRLLSETAERQRQGEMAPCPWWGLLLPAGAIPPVDLAARTWLKALERCGVELPDPVELVESLRPFEALVESPLVPPSTASRALH